MLLKGWEKQIIWRLDTDTGSELPFTTHKHPFTTLPYLKSHLRPQFTIFNAGLKLSRALGEPIGLIEGSQEVDIADDLRFVVNLYQAWSRLPPTTHKQDQSYLPSRPPSHSHDCDDSDDDYADLVDEKEDDPEYEDQTSDKKGKWKAA